jgi:hypothetical protein
VHKLRIKELENSIDMVKIYISPMNLWKNPHKHSILIGKNEEADPSTRIRIDCKV